MTTQEALRVLYMDDDASCATMVMKTLRGAGYVVERVASEQALIREKEAAVEALRRSEERYRLLVDRSPDAMLVFCDGTVGFANAAAVSLLGAQNQESLLGRKAAELWSTASGVERPILNLIECGVTSVTSESLVEDHFVRLDGQRIDVEVAT